MVNKSKWIARSTYFEAAKKSPQDSLLLMSGEVGVWCPLLRGVSRSWMRGCLLGSGEVATLRPLHGISREYRVVVISYATDI